MWPEDDPNHTPWDYAREADEEWDEPEEYEPVDEEEWSHDDHISGDG